VRTSPSRGRSSVGRALLLALALLAAAAAPATAAPGEDARASTRIVGGADAAPAEAPFQVAILGPSDDDFEAQFCGGSILDATHVVTAAHCVFHEDRPGSPMRAASTLRVLAGTTVLRSPGRPPYDDVVVVRPVAAITPHPLYLARADAFAFDVAVLTLDAPLYAGEPRIGDGSRIAPVPLVSQDPPAGTAIRHYGWGDTEPHPVAERESDVTPRYARDLQVFSGTVVDRARCRAAYDMFSPVHLCSGVLGGGRGTCQGDSGGPGVVGGPAGPELAGVVGSGIGCAARGYPGVDARVASPVIGDFLRTTAAGGRYAPPPGAEALGRSEPRVDEAAPAIAFGRLPRTIRGATLVARYRLGEGGRERHQLFLGGVLVASYRGATADGWFRMTFRLDARGRELVRRARRRGRALRAVWRVTATDGAGNAATATRRWRVRPVR
jgi:hypothetical protein